ncbi:hypothetical protein Vafri_18975 [Volvox africanus]|uniref:Uncharacterized protein n=1 Tax=Volvox africanus TaxID=51714 RepID=A0A8J4BPA0_9CHLO|nr:hypothetical protein Vafri_18975 [Volvox africanus]
MSCSRRTVSFARSSFSNCAPTSRQSGFSSGDDNASPPYDSASMTAVSRVLCSGLILAPLTQAIRKTICAVAVKSASQPPPPPPLRPAPGPGAAFTPRPDCSSSTAASIACSEASSRPDRKPSPQGC